MWRDRSRLFFSVGQVLGGLTTALLAVSVGSLLARPWMPSAVGLALLGAVAALVLSGDLGLHQLRFPQSHRQVPTSVIADGSDVGALRFGFEMGTGMRTYMPTNMPYVVLCACLLVATWDEAAAAGAGFGASRAAMALGRVYSVDIDRWDRQWHRHAPLLVRSLSLSLSALLGAITIEIWRTR